MNFKTKRLTFSAICLALCLLLPFLTGQIPQIGNIISPMHIPVFLCGLLCGAPYGLLVGFLAPVVRNFLFGMPPLMPTGLAMAFEMAAYGVISGLAMQYLSGSLLKRTYCAQLLAMFLGRLVWGAASFFLHQAIGEPFTLPMFLAGGFINALPAIILHILIIPPIVIALKKAQITE